MPWALRIKCNCLELNHTNKTINCVVGFLEWLFYNKSYKMSEIKFVRILDFGHSKLYKHYINASTIFN